MHKYLKSIGFRGIDNDDYRMLLRDIEAHPTQQFVSEDFDGDDIIEYIKEYPFGFGVVDIGRLDEEDGFIREYSYPYFEGKTISSNADIELIRCSDRECYQGILEDNRIGIDLVFFVIDSLALIKQDYEEGKKLNTGRVKLSGLATEGKVLFQLADDKIYVPDPVLEKSRAELYEQARNGDVDAIDELSSKDYDTYNLIQERMKSEDTLTILQSYIMPTGIECDKYSILGTILDFKIMQNYTTKQNVVLMQVEASGIVIEIAINNKDLIGELKIGRRFKGEIWLQGKIF
jgi:hypothetical protein